MSFGLVGRSEGYGVCSDEVRFARSVFRPAHVRAKNDSDFFASADANSARQLNCESPPCRHRLHGGLRYSRVPFAFWRFVAFSRKLRYILFKGGDRHG